MLKALYEGMDLDLFKRHAHSVDVLLGLMDCSSLTLRLDHLSIGYSRWVSPVLSCDERDEWNGGFVSASEKENCNSLEFFETQNVDGKRLMHNNILAPHGLGMDSLFLFVFAFNSKGVALKMFDKRSQDNGRIVDAYFVVVISHCIEVNVLVYYGKGCNSQSYGFVGTLGAGIMNIGLFQPLLEGSLQGGIGNLTARKFASGIGAQRGGFIGELVMNNLNGAGTTDEYIIILNVLGYGGTFFTHGLSCVSDGFGSWELQGLTCLRLMSKGDEVVLITVVSITCQMRNTGTCVEVTLREEGPMFWFATLRKGLLLSMLGSEQGGSTFFRHCYDLFF